MLKISTEKNEIGENRKQTNKQTKKNRESSGSLWKSTKFKVYETLEDWKKMEKTQINQYQEWDRWNDYSLYMVAQTVKNPPIMQKTLVWSLGQEDSLEKGMVMHSSILAWRIPWTEEPGGLQFMGSQRVGHD